jgi:RNA polymerase sigma-70 factor (ECF subfamily)
VPDVERVRAAQAGDAVAMSEVLDALLPTVGRVCGSIALDAGPDAAQEALIQVMRDLRRLRDPARLLAWARRIAAREAVRHARRGRAAAGEAAELAPLPAPGDPGLARDVRRVLAALAPEQRAILVLRDLEGLGEAEAARELGVALGTAKSRLHRARQAFRERWRS